MTLDYTIYSDKERKAYIDKYLNQHATDYMARDAGLTQTAEHQLQQMADYILFGKDPQKLTNAVQRKQITKPATKYATFAKKEPQSLEQLMDNPDFPLLETSIHSIEQKNTYVHPKPTINHNYLAGGKANAVCPYAAKCALAATCIQESLDKCYACDTWIPGMIDLWDSIAAHQHTIAVANGKEQPYANQPPAKKWSPLTMYKNKHWLAQLRKTQYTLKEGYKPTIPTAFSMSQPGAIDWGSNSGYWENCGSPNAADLVLNQTKEKEKEKDSIYTYYTIGKDEYRYAATTTWTEAHWEHFHLIREHIIDFTNPEHIYELINNYRSLLKHYYDDLNGDIKWILFDLDTIVDRTILSDVQCEILNYRILNWTNERIAAAIQQEFGHVYNPNYISFTFKTHICTKIAKTAGLMQREYSARNNPNAWKKCTCCGELLLIDEFNFVHKNVTKDGFAARCKRCDSRIRRKEDKNGKQNMQNMPEAKV